MYQLSNAAKRDLDRIAEYTAQDNPARAVRFLREVQERFLWIARNPELYQLRPEVGDDLRIAVFGAYVILFRILPDFVWMERIVFGGPAMFQ